MCTRPMTKYNMPAGEAYHILLKGGELYGVDRDNKIVLLRYDEDTGFNYYSLGEYESNKATPVSRATPISSGWYATISLQKPEYRDFYAALLTSAVSCYLVDLQCFALAEFDYEGGVFCLQYSDGTSLRSLPLTKSFYESDVIPCSQTAYRKYYAPTPN